MPSHERADDTSSQDGSSDVNAKSPPAKYSPAGSGSIFAGPHAIPITSNIVSPRISGASAMGAVLPGLSSVHGSLETSGAPSSPSAMKPPSPSKEEHNANLFTHRPPSMGDSGFTGEIEATVSGTLGANPASSDITKRNTLAADDRFSSDGMIQPLMSPSSSRTPLPHSTNVNDATTTVGSVGISENTAMGSKTISPLAVSGMQWKPGSLSTQNEIVCDLRSFTFL